MEDAINAHVEPVTVASDYFIGYWAVLMKKRYQAQDVFIIATIKDMTYSFRKSQSISKLEHQLNECVPSQIVKRVGGMIASVFDIGIAQASHSFIRSLR
jgi:hypothetical protein